MDGFLYGVVAIMVAFVVVEAVVEAVAAWHRWRR